jgi:DNA-binding YbaB/EbfC family protein
MNPFKLLGALKDIGKIQEEMKESAAKLRENVYDGSAGGGLVTVKATGDLQLASVSVDPSLFAEKDADLIQELIVEAANAALAKAREDAAETMQKTLSERLNLPGMEGMLKGMMP